MRAFIWFVVAMQLLSLFGCFSVFWKGTDDKATGASFVYSLTILSWGLSLLCGAA